MMVESFPILIVGSTLPTSLENIYRRAFKKNGFNDVDILSTDEGRPKNRVLNRIFPFIVQQWAAQRLRNQLQSRKGRYCWIIIFKGMEFDLKTLEECKQLTPSSIWVNINPDDPFNIVSRGASNKNILKSLTFYDFYCSWSKSIAEQLQKSGCKSVVYLAFGYDEELHLVSDQPNVRIPEFISFIGTWDQDRETLLSKLVGFNLKIQGGHWQRAKRDFPFKDNVCSRVVFGMDLSRIVSSAAISLNPMRAQNRGSHNMRTFEIPASGGLMLTYRSKEQQLFFPENEACYMYGDASELRKKIEYILANKDEAESVRKQGKKLVKEHTYTNRVKYLLEVVSSMS
jgi:spore maturation protein CgeB